MYILGISGNPRLGGNTEIIIKEALNAAEEEGGGSRIHQSLRLSA
jgi:multimeric flavodoxin WrbA